MIFRKYAKPAMEIVSVDVNIPYAFTKWEVVDKDGNVIGGGPVIEEPGSGGTSGGDSGWDPDNWGEND